MRIATFGALAGALVFSSVSYAQESRPAESPFPALGAPAGVYGAGVTQDKGHKLADAVAKVDALHGRPVRVDAVIQDVCRKKGCWMVLVDGEREVRVKFKDYAFFVPRDAGGREAIVEGILTKKVIPEAEAKHYAEESGDPKAAESIVGDQEVFAFTATGVEILGGRALPPVAEASDPAQLQALQAKLAAAKEAGKTEAKVATLGEAMTLMRQVRGPRSVEFALCAEVDGWFVFSDAAGKPFQGGYAVRKGSGAVHRF